MQPAHIFVVIGLFSLAALWTTAWLGRRVDLVDHPSVRKKHAGDIPLTGGIAIFATLMFGTMVLTIPPYTTASLMIAGGVVIVSVYDDYKHLNPILRLALHLFAGILLATTGGIVISSVGDLLGTGNIPLLMLSVPLSGLGVAGLCNAYNMIDGIDGLAASLLALPLATLYILAHNAGHEGADFALLVFIPCMMFLLFNLGPNSAVLPRIFLGDAGSVVLGFLLAASMIYFSQGEHGVIRPVTALWLVALPLMDTIATMVGRWRDGARLTKADRSHLHYLLVDQGMSPRRALALLLAYAYACTVAGLALESAPESLSLLAFLVVFTGHCGFVLRRRGRQSALQRS
jgi:UDP-GlcNAc:undecaprenyl-phosphate GlcNAc-1-phosphate transferase